MSERPSAPQPSDAAPSPASGPVATASASPEHERSLQSTLKPSWVFAIALGSAVGWGAFMLPVDWLQDGGTAGALIGFAIGAVLIGIIGISYGMIIRVLPVTGGELAFALQEFGRRNAFVVGWFLALAYACIVALNATAVALVVRMLLPGLMEQVHLYTVAGWDIYLPEVIVAALAIIATGLMNVMGTALSGRFQFIACIVLIAAVVAILIGAIVHGIQHGFALYPAFHEGSSPVSAIAVMIAFAPWAFVGFDNVPQAAGEFDFSPRKALFLILAAIGTAGLVYVVMIFSSSVALGPGGNTHPDAAWPTAEVIAGIMGPFGKALMVIAVLMGVATGLNGFTVSSSRVLMAMGRAKMLPAVFGRVESKHRTPVVAIVFTSVLCLLAPFFGRSALQWIVDMTSVGVTIAYGYTCLAAFKLAHPTRAGGHDAFGRARPVYRVIALIGAILALGFLLLLFIPGSPGRLGPQPLIALAVWVVLGAVFLATRHRALMSAPEEELEKVILDPEP
ncbi:amino acid permease [Brachybacterium endophyticum]|uniref:Amino acid permease n=1 Tax=Brachybacterium endophyticum TaxID=2182385 RepID=A0A2U2RKP9_9MICO|nr:APC family permease [Brachybacterium endophyticum]PWH06440.1 amino acid permease [Brachybacterium endophyticum]